MDNIDRRGFLKCMAWAGTGLVWTVSAGVPTSRLLGEGAASKDSGAFTFTQISDSHLGFNKPANTDVSATLQAAIDRVNDEATQPDLLLHTGDITHGAQASEFDPAQQILAGLKQKQVFYVPGEHDTSADDAKLYLERYGKGTKGSGWYSFDHRSVHFIGLNNVLQLEGMGKLGPDQIAWMKQDLAQRKASTPIVIFAHIPLWTVYPEWGWGTQDSEQALAELKRFGSVTILNGHIHQTLQKVEGSVRFHTACSTAFPQPAPGSAPHAGPVAVPPGSCAACLASLT
ncbi:MAG: metallophosphoesterase [Acidobacteriaceae bacterium]